MAKKRKAKDGKPESKRSAALSGPLASAIELFSKGDYVEARRMFDDALKDSDLSEENRQVAKALRGSLGLDKHTLLVGLACVGLFLLVILVAVLKQP